MMNLNYLSAKVIVTLHDDTFNLLILMNTEHQNASDSKHHTSTHYVRK